MEEIIGDQSPALIWLRYSLTRPITPSLQRQLLLHYPDPSQLEALLSCANPQLNSNDATLNKKVNHALQQRYSRQVNAQVQEALAWEARSPDHHIVCLSDPAYPKLLLATRNAPPVLYVSGDINCLNTPCVAIVGARKASHGALEQARQIAQTLGENGITVVSGLALGIDAAAHQGAIQGHGQTIAVSATGPEKIYPKIHLSLAQKIKSNGAVMTEFPLASSLRPHCFPRRNRIISGMSIGVLVVEAALPSGTLTTAQHALRQGREVMAMPGAVQNPLTRGCHELLKNGAALIENANDVLACLSTELHRHLVDTPVQKRDQPKPLIYKKLANMPPDALTLLDCLGFDPVSIDTLMQRSGLNASQVTGALTHLELSGVIVGNQSGRYVRCKQSGI